MPTTLSIDSFLIKESECLWIVNLPVVLPQVLIGDIEEILYEKRNVPGFLLRIKYWNEFPFNSFEYEEHSKSIDGLFKRLFEYQYKISLLVISGANHYRILENENYAWEKFLNDVILFENPDFQSMRLVTVGIIARYIEMQMDQESFKSVEDDVISAAFEQTSRDLEELTVHSIKIPTGSIIQMTLSPETVDH